MIWETGKGPIKTVQVSRLLNVRSSRAFQERSNTVLVFPLPFRGQETSGDSYPGLEVPSTAPPPADLCLFHMPCVIGNYVFFLLWNPLEEVNHPFVFELLISFLRNQRQLWSCEQWEVPLFSPVITMSFWVVAVVSFEKKQEEKNELGLCFVTFR